MSTLDESKLYTGTRVAGRFQQLKEVAIEYEGFTQKIILRPPDVSTRGMFINTPKPFPEGAVLKIRFRLARTDQEVSVRAEVRYCLSGVGIGVEFIEISREDQRAIERAMNPR